MTSRYWIYSGHNATGFNSREIMNTEKEEEFLIKQKTKISDADINSIAGNPITIKKILLALRRITIIILSIAFFIYVNFYSNFGIVGNLKNGISPEPHFGRVPGALFFVPVFFDLIAFYIIVTQKKFKDQMSGVIALLIITVIFGILVSLGLKAM